MRSAGITELRIEHRLDVLKDENGRGLGLKFNSLSIQFANFSRKTTMELLLGQLHPHNLLT